MTDSKMVIRKCHNLDEISACVNLQKEVWNFADAELVPLRMFVVAEKIGGQGIGAVSPGRVLGILRQFSPIGPDLSPAMLKFIQDHYVSWSLQDFARSEIMQIDAREATWITLENRIIG